MCVVLRDYVLALRIQAASVVVVVALFRFSRAPPRDLGGRLGFRAGFSLIEFVWSLVVEGIGTLVEISLSKHGQELNKWL